MDIRKLLSNAFLTTSIIALSACGGGGGGGSNEPDADRQEVDNPPVISNVSINPESESTFGELIEVSAAVSDDNALASVVLYINDVEAGPLTDEDNDGVYTISEDQLEVGSYKWYIKATDDSGQKVETDPQDYSVLPGVDPIEDNPPVIADYVLETEPGDIFTLNVSATVTDDNALSSVDLYINGELETSLMSDGGNFYAASWELPGYGEYEVYIIATDDSNQETMGPYRVISVGGVIEDTPPVITNFIVNPKSARLGDNIVITAQVTDDIDLQSVVLLIDGQEADTLTDGNGDDVYTYVWTPGAADTYSVQIKATDSNQQITISDAAEVVVNPEIIDNPPVISSFIVNPQTPKLGEQVVINAAVTDDSAVKSVGLYINGNKAVNLTDGNGDNVYSYTWTPPAAVTYSLQVRAVDDADQVTASAATDVVVSPKDIEVPVLSALIVSPENTVEEGTQVTASINVTGGADVNKVELLANNSLVGLMIKQGSNYSIVWTPEVGNYQLKVQVTYAQNKLLASDAASLKVTSQQVDLPPEILSFTTSPESTAEKGEQVLISAKVTDDSAVDSVYLYINGNRAVPLTDSNGDDVYTYTWTPPAVTTYSLQVKAQDDSQQVTDSSVIDFEITDEVVEDNVAPQISNFSLSKTANISEGDKITATVTVTDNVQVASVELNLDDAKLATMSANGNQYTYTWDTSGYSGNDYQLQVSAKDTSNNSSLSQVITIDIEENNWVAPDGTGIIKFVSDFGDNPGHHEMFLYVPEDLEPGAPVVMALHGCNQSYGTYSFTDDKIDNNQSGQSSLTDAMTFAQDSQWHVLADEYKFIVIYPQQANQQGNEYSKDTGYGNEYRCFNWSGFYGAKVYRGEGGNKSLIEMINYVKANYDVNNDKVFVTGLSAGGAMTNLMAATYPDVFAGAAPMAGIPYHCALNEGESQAVNNSYGCMGIDSNFQGLCLTEACVKDTSLLRTPKQWGDLVRTKGYPGYTGKYPKTIIWQGDNDQYVAYEQLHETAEQWVNAHDSSITDISSVAIEGKVIKDDANHIYTEYEVDGEVAVATVTLPGMSHAITVDPNNSGEDGGGKTAQWSKDYGIYSSFYTAKFWGLIDGEGKPKVEITSPADNEVLAESTAYIITADATFDLGIDSVEFYVNSQLVCADSSSPYECDTTTAGFTRGDELAIEVLAYSNAVAKPGKGSVTAWVGERTFKCVDYSGSMYDHRSATPPRAELTSAAWSSPYDYAVIGSGEAVEGLSYTQATNDNYDIREVADGYFELGTCAER